MTEAVRALDFLRVQEATEQTAPAVERWEGLITQVRTAPLAAVVAVAGLSLRIRALKTMAVWAVSTPLLTARMGQGAVVAAVESTHFHQAPAATAATGGRLAAAVAAGQLKLQAP